MYGEVVNARGESWTGIGAPELPRIAALVKFRRDHAAELATNPALAAHVTSEIAAIEELRRTAGVTGQSTQHVYVDSRRTLYSRIGDLFSWALAIFTSAGLLALLGQDMYNRITRMAPIRGIWLSSHPSHPRLNSASYAATVSLMDSGKEPARNSAFLLVPKLDLKKERDRISSRDCVYSKDVNALGSELMIKLDPAGPPDTLRLLARKFPTLPERPKSADLITSDMQLQGFLHSPLSASPSGL
jgi:hypothetical protein